MARLIKVTRETTSSYFNGKKLSTLAKLLIYVIGESPDGPEFPIDSGYLSRVVEEKVEKINKALKELEAIGFVELEGVS